MQNQKGGIICRRMKVAAMEHAGQGVRYEPCIDSQHVLLHGISRSSWVRNAHEIQPSTGNAVTL